MTAKLKVIRGSGNVFRDLGHGEVEAKNLQLRSQLMTRIHNFHRGTRMTQAESAKLFALSQRRLNALLRGRLSLFDLDTLVDIASRVGLSVRLVIRKAA